MLEQLESIRERFEEVAQQMTQPEVVSDMKNMPRFRLYLKRLF